MRKILMAVILGATSLGTGVFAQTASGQETGSGRVGEIIVTAQKREQNLQDVPIAISAISQDYLEKREVTSISSLSGLAPNLKVNTAGGNQTTALISIRGGIQGNPQLYFEPSVGVYMDGIYIAKAQGALFDVADIERIEVLRGPQGTLYGRNAVAGAVNIVTKKPSGELGGRIEGSYGNYDYWRLRGTLDLPQFGIFSAKLSGQLAKRDGFYKVTGNSSTNEAHTLDSKSGMVQLRAEPSDTLSLDYVIDMSVSDQQSAPAQAVSGVGSIAPYVTPRKRQKVVSFDSPNFEYAKNWGHALTAVLDLGNVGSLKSMTALRKQKYRDALDLDGTPVSLAVTGRDSRYKQFSQELQLTGEVDRLNYVLGGYYFEDDGYLFNPQSYFSGLARTDSRFGFTTKAYAVYAQADYQITDKFTLIAGLRYTREKKSVERYLAQLTAVGPVMIVDLPKGAVPAESFSKLSPTVTLAYSASPDLNFYARYAQGFRSGGFNAVSTSPADVRRIFKPQVENTYEVGLKSLLFENRLQLNATAFRSVMDDLQLSVFVPGVSAASILVNAGKARTQGLEVEAVVRPVDTLMLQAGVGYLHTKYKRFIDGGVNVAGNRAFPHAPKWTLSTSADWTVAAENWGKVSFLVDLNLTSSFFIEASPLVPETPAQLPASLTNVPTQTLLDARLILSELAIGNAKGSVSFWGKNLLNEKDPNFFVNFGTSFQSLIDAYFPNPRTYGITLGIEY